MEYMAREVGQYKHFHILNLEVIHPLKPLSVSGHLAVKHFCEIEIRARLSRHGRQAVKSSPVNRPTVSDRGITE